MQKILFKTMEAGNSYHTLALVTGIIEKETKTKQPFCMFTLRDGSAEINANMFSQGNSQATLEANSIYLKKVCIVKIDVSLYNGSTSYQVKEISLAAEGSYSLGDFIKKSPVNEEKMFDKIIEVLGTCNSSIKDIAINLYNENREKLLYWSAAKAMHHNYHGGLLYHTYRMLSHATVVCGIYKNLNRSLLVTGTVLHDIGKLVELETDDMGLAGYTVDGNLFGHILIGIEMINNEVAKNPGAYNPEEVRLLKHMIASHHMTQEMGSIKPPATQEAIALAYIDVMDARMETCDALYADMEPGECMDRNAIGLDARLYKANL